MNEFDNALMKEHIMIHKALIKKLYSFKIGNVSNDLFSIITIHIDALNHHIKAMENLLVDKEEIIPDMPDYKPRGRLMSEESYKVVDGLFTSASMAKNNFQSALMMREKDNKDAHLKMAKQDREIADMYHDYLQTIKEV